MHSRLEIFKNAGFSFTCRRTKTEVFEYDDVMHHIWQALGVLCERCYRTFTVLAFSCGRAKNIFDYPTRGHEFFPKRGGKKIVVFKKLRIGVNEA